MTFRKQIQLHRRAMIEMYAASTPSANYLEVIDRKDLPVDFYKDYKIDISSYIRILKKYSRLIKTTYKRKLFENTIHLGHSPTLSK